MNSLYISFAFVVFWLNLTCKFSKSNENLFPNYNYISFMHEWIRTHTHLPLSPPPSPISTTFNFNSMQWCIRPKICDRSIQYNIYIQSLTIPQVDCFTCRFRHIYMCCKSFKRHFSYGIYIEINNFWMHSTHTHTFITYARWFISCAEIVPFSGWTNDT